MNGERTRPLVFRERTNTLYTPGPTVLANKLSMDRVSAPRNLSTDVIGVKEAAREDATANLPSGIGDARIQRSLRYLAAEQDLSDSLKRCRLQHSSQELQIEALGKVKSLLTTHVTASREQVGKLRKLLTDRATEPVVYKAAQRERWMEERRLLAAEELSKVLEQHLSSLSSQPLPPSTSLTPASDEEACLPTSVPSSNPEANLVRFFKSTSRQRNFSRNRTRRRVTVALRPRSDKGLERPRIHDHKHPIPLLLPGSKPKPYLPFEIPSKHVAPTSLLPSPIAPTSSTPTSAPDPASPSPPSFPQTTLLPSIAELPSPALSSMPPSSPSGTAIIWTAKLRSDEEILSDADLAVDVPDYVSDLLAGLDSVAAVDARLVDLQVEDDSNRQPLKAKRSRSSRFLHSAQIKPTSSPYLPRSDDRPVVATPPSPLHKSPSRKRISALFSLPEALSSRRGVSTDASPRPKRISTAVLEVSEPDSRRPVSVSFADLPSIESVSGESRHHGDEKVLKRIRRSLSVLRRN